MKKWENEKVWQEWKISIVYRLFFILIGFSGIYLGLSEENEDAFMGHGTAINFYTLQSNIWVLVLEVYLLFHTILKHRKGHETEQERELENQSAWNLGVFKYVFTVSITLTFLVYWFMLAPYIGAQDLLKPSNILLHGISPVMMLLDFLFFDSEYVFSKRAEVLTLIPAIYYLIFILLRAEISPISLAFGSRYPYWFMDVDAFRMDW